MFNDKLEVGQLAMIIGCSKPENRSIIGKVVTVEAITSTGDDCSEFFEECRKRLIESKSGMAFCSGVTAPVKAFASDGTPLLDGITRLKLKYLMPIPKLKESEIQKEKELEAA